jgi:RNA polymerase sigma-70 factor, ECF subfamily
MGTAEGWSRLRSPGWSRRRSPASDKDFDRLYAENAESLLSFLTLRTGDRVLAEDVLADTFERVLRKRGTFDRRRGSEKGWLYTIALNLLRDHFRRQEAERKALQRAGEEPREDPAGQPPSEVEDRDALKRALSVLSTDERNAVALHFGADLTMPEIAKLIREPRTTVEGRIYRALRKMREELVKAEDESSLPPLTRIWGR